MKSLEIADELYDDVKRLCDYYIAGRWNDEKEVFSVKVNNAMFDLIKRIQKDKQDLEVLEIIRKNLLRSKYGVYESKNNGVVEYNKVTMREIKEDEFDREEFKKLKQWLEENENDR